MKLFILIPCNTKTLTIMKKTIAAVFMSATLMSHYVNAAKADVDSVHFQQWTFGMVAAYSSGCEKLSESGDSVAFHIAKRAGLDLEDLGDYPGFVAGWEQMNREGCKATKEFFKGEMYDLLFKK